MGLIDNTKQFCLTCKNKGVVDTISAEDMDKFDKEYDRLDKMGCLSADQVYDKASQGCKKIISTVRIVKMDKNIKINILSTEHKSVCI